MSSSSLLVLLGTTLLAFALTVECVNNLYSYDDGNGGEEHCCIARVGRNFCLATPITRSLVQVNKQCHRFDEPKKRRSGKKKGDDSLADKIVRRVDIKSSEEVGDRILFELQTPLDSAAVQKDMVCLSSKKPSMNFDKCYLELPDESIEETDDDQPPRRRRKHRGGDRHRRRHHRFGGRKHTVEDSSEENEERVVDEATPTATNHTVKEVRRSELHQKVHIREGRGLGVRQMYTLNLTRIREVYPENDRCVSWYRKQTRKLRRKPSTKSLQVCRQLNDHVQHCINKLLFSDTETSQLAPNTIVSLSKGSKLYCESQAGDYKLLGVKRHGTVCLLNDNQVVIAQKFNDISGISNAENNEEMLRFIDAHPKFQAEFGHDCHGTNDLVEVTLHEQEERGKGKRQERNRP